MTISRIEIFKQMLATDPINSDILFGLAKEYEKARLHQELIETLERYLALSEDEGNAYGMLARAYEQLGQRAKARQSLQQGIEVAAAHGHPGMAEEYRMTLSSDYED